MRYRIVAEAYRDLEGATARLELIGRLASLVRQTPTELLPTVALLCQGQIAPDFAGVELGVNERLAARAVATAAGVPPEQVLALARETGDLGLAAERLLQELDPDRPATLEVRTVFEGLHQVAAAEGTGSQGRKLAGLGSLLQQATPLEARYLVRTCTGSLRLGIGTATILDALAEVHAGGRPEHRIGAVDQRRDLLELLGTDLVAHRHSPRDRGSILLLAPRVHLAPTPSPADRRSP